MRDAAAEDRFLSREEMDSESIVYFLYSAGLVRIGTSKQGHQRALAHAAAMPNRMTIFLAMKGGTVTEYRLHTKFSADRQHGEWFVLSDYMREFVRECGSQHYELLEAAENIHLGWVRFEAARLGLLS